jgi:2-desacetyl-2-hydroxyethyl bacteriochlorophyllide A dehydrogenase
VQLRARAYWTIGPEQGEIRDEPLSPPGAGQLLIEALHSGISRGTELLVHRGAVPESEHARMCAPHQAGQFPWPVKYGYCSVGRVVAGADADDGWLGRVVFCLYPHQTAYVMNAAALIAVPPEVPPARAVLAANMETALNAVWDAEIKAGDRVIVVGAGVVGSLVAYLAGRHPGADVSLVDVEPSRAKLAERLGVGFAPPDQVQGGADVVVHASGTPAGLRAALALAGPEALVLELSWYGAQSVALPLGEAFHSQRLRLRSSQVGGLSPSQLPRWTRQRRLALALRLLADPQLDALIDQCGPFEALPEIMAKLARSGSALCHRIDYAPRGG